MRADIDYPNRIILTEVIVKPLGEQNALASVRAKPVHDS